MKRSVEVRAEDGKEIVFENGWKGVFSIGKEEKVSLWDLVVAGRRFTCTPMTRPDFVDYLAGLEAAEIDVMFPYSMETKMPSGWKERKGKKKDQPVEDEKGECIHYYCTVRVPRGAVQPLFDNVMGRAEEFVKLMARMIKDQWLRDQQDKSCEI